MQRLDPNASISTTQEAKQYLEFLKDKKVFPYMIDAYFFAAAYAMNRDVEVEPVSGLKTLAQNISFVDSDVFLALDAAVKAICKRKGKPEPKDNKEVANIVIQYAEAGLKLLKARWEGKIKSQIQNDICKIIVNNE
ncbi:hypothetical protein PN462_10815 [Spirulina sp. CS-785/01]|uniref:hypothetical protein n=1 Tax=Spirulina sp. CS-785/01 TaxID=3021716 RepID=UPI00232D7582|nr:hypothetical protein [Spirulina sp. CS-785/01]MDB9313591.1 hypothetical protein [Spirulina sp. CS-785/01]